MMMRRRIHDTGMRSGVEGRRRMMMRRRIFSYPTLL
jgi:hypothetical protein